MATALHIRLKQGLDEARILVLGAQLLLGFQFRAFVQPAFDRLSIGAQYAELGGLALLLVVLALVISPAPFHRLAEDGEDTRRMNRMVSTVMSVALVPFALALGVDIFVAFVRVSAISIAVAGSLAAIAVALAAWYGLGFVTRQRGAGTGVTDSDREKEEAMAEAKGTDIDTKVNHVLTEARVVLPGVQALLGFQLAGILTDAFERLPQSSQIMHLVSLAALALVVVLLVAPAAYHRIVEAGENTQRFHRVASVLILSALGPLALGIALDVIIVVRKLTESLPVAIGAGLIAALLFVTAWYVVPARARRHRHSGEAQTWLRVA